MLIANADRLTEIECHSPNLINTDLSECTKLQRIDLSDSTALGTGIGAQPILNIQNCKYLRYCDCRNTQLTAIYTMQAGGNLEEIYYPQSTQVVQLTNQTYLHTVGLPSTNPCENLADVMITNCNAIKTLSSETTVLDFNTLKYVQNLNITNSLSGLNSMHFNGFDKLRNVTLSSLKELDSIGFEDMMPVTTTSTLKNITISDCPLITSLSFNVSSDDYKVAFASNGKLDLGGLQSLKSIKCNTSVKGLDTLIVPTSLTDLRFTTEYGDGINEIKNIWSASAVHNNDGFEGIDFQDMTIEFIDMLGLNSISNAINFHIAPKTQNPNLNTARDGSTAKPWFRPVGSMDLSNYTGLMIGMLRGVDLNKLDVVINTDRDQVDLTSLFECATLPTAQNIVTKTNNILAKFPKSVIWDYMFKGCDLSFSPNDIRIPNRGLSLKGMYKDSNVTEDVSLPNVIMAVDEMFMNCTGITTYEENWLKTYAKLTFTVPTSNGTSGSWDDSGNYTEGTNYNQFLYIPSNEEKTFKIMTTGTGVVRINHFYNASFLSRIVYTPEFDSYPYVVTIPDGCNKVIFVCDKTIGFASEGIMTTSNCYTNTGGALSEIPTSWGGYGLDKNVTSIYVIDTTLLTNTTTFNLVLQDNQAGITDWGDGVTNSEKSHTYAEHGVYTIKTKSWANGTPSDDLKTALIEVKQIKIGHNENSRNYSNAFNGCSKLTKVTAYNLAPTNCDSIFKGCTSLTEVIGLDTWDMSNCTNIQSMFYGVGITDPIPVYNMLSTFIGSSADSLFRESKIESIELGRFPSSIKNFKNVAYRCSNLKTIDFTNCAQDTTNWENAFCHVRGITSVIGLETLNASDGVRLLGIFFNTDLSNVGIIDMSGMTCKINTAPQFSGTKVTTIKMGFDWSNITSDLPNYMFSDFNTLENVEWGINLKANFNGYTSLANHNNLTVQSLLNLFNALYDFSIEGGTHTVIIGSTNIAKLTREQMLIAIKKHWTIQGASIQGVFRDTDISTLTSDDTVTAVAIELTADNYLTRIDEVLGVYTNAVDVYLFDDGSVTTLANMCHNNNTATKDRIQNVTFLDGYFENCIYMERTFFDCLSLTTVSNIPNSVTTMSFTFQGCKLLTTVSNLPNSVTSMISTFTSCKLLTTIPNIPNGVIDMSSTFQYCSSLTTVPNIPNNVTNMQGTFYGCTSLTTVPNIPNNVTNMQGTFSGCTSLTTVPNIPNNVTNMQGTFYGCTSLTTVPNIPNNVTNMQGTFQNCTSLTTVPNIPNSVTNMQVTFNNCRNLTAVPNISNSVTNMQGTFSGCRNLTTVPNIPNSVTDMNNAFYNCTLLEEVNLSNRNFGSITVNENTFRGCTSLTKITLNNITDTSNREAGAGLRLTLNSIPQPVEIVMDEFAMTDFSNLFQGVTKIKNDIVFPTNATNVSNCFKDCTGMTHIHSNWKTEYTAMENTTDCYAGCTGITHCDGIDLGVCDYISGLDEIPIAWGGYGFSKDVTSIIVVEIPSDNYEMSTYGGGGSTHLDDGLVKWGDGSTTSLYDTHTYATAGTYIIKCKINKNGLVYSSKLKQTAIEIKQLASSIVGNRDYSSILYGYSKLTKVTAYNLAPTDCGGMFKSCSSLTEIVGMDTWNMSNCTNVGGMFRNCSSLTEVTFTMTNYSDCNSIFWGAKKLININVDLKPTDISDIIRECANLAYIKSMDLSNATVNTNGMAWSTVNNSLQTFNIISTIKCDMRHISNFNGLTVDGIMNIINNLYDYASEGNTDTHTVMLGSTNLAKLTAEQIAIATNKGWTVS